MFFPQFRPLTPYQCAMVHMGTRVASEISAGVIASDIVMRTSLAVGLRCLPIDRGLVVNIHYLIT